MYNLSGAWLNLIGSRKGMHRADKVLSVAVVPSIDELALKSYFA